MFSSFNFLKMKAMFVLTLLGCLILNAHSQNDAAADSIQHFSGTIPSRIEMGINESRNITCYTGDVDSSTISFFEHNFKTDIQQPDDRIIILNNTTVVLTVNSSKPFNYEFKCMSGGSGIGSTIVHIDTKPGYIEDFSCQSYDFQNMTCSFTKPHSNLLTTYKINYTDTEGALCKKTCKNIKVTEEKVYCYLTGLNDDSFYVKLQERYFFNISISNAAGNYSQYEVVNHYKNIKPAKLNIKVKNETTNSVVLHWRNENHVYYNRTNFNLEHEICLKPKNFDIAHCTIRTDQNCKNEECNISINNLEFPGYKYNLTVRVKLESTPSDMWSEPFIKIFETKPERPYRPPITDIGGFYFDSVKKLQLFWQELKFFEHNGPGFRYIISETDVQGNLLNRTSTNETTLKLNWNGTYDRVFHIKASNDIGDSNGFSVIRVPRDKRHKQSYEPKTDSKVLKNNNAYELSWKPPERFHELLNYTVFWCTSKPENFNECKDSINFTQIDKHQEKFTTEPQNPFRTLNLAVSANYADYNAGMHWALCTADEYADLIKLVPEIKDKTATTIELKWNPDPICTSIVKGYNITYCEIDKNVYPVNETITCLTEPIIKTIETDYVKSYTIKNLKPYSTYRINMLMFSKKQKNGALSEDLFVETLEDAPSAPRDLQVDKLSITSNSVNVSWLPPKFFNGKIRFYTIRLEKLDTRGYLDFRKHLINGTHDVKQRITYTLDSLSSYTKYMISVSATTVEDSVASNNVGFATMIGIPTSPQNVSVVKQQDDDYGFVNWEVPALLSGRLEFYVVAMHIIKSNATTVKTSLVKGNRCYFRFSECNATISFKVRAVNFANKTETDYKTFPIDLNSVNNQISAIQTGEYSPFECENNLFLDSRYQLYDPNKEAAVQHVNGYSFFSSPWQNGDRTFGQQCYNLNRNFITYLVATFILMLFITSATYSILKRYKKMKNIHVVLPTALADHLSQNKYNGSAAYEVERSKELTSSNDCLIKNRENLRLLAAQRQYSLNAGSEVDMTASDYGSSVPNQNLNNVSSNNSDKEEQSNNSSSFDEHLSPSRSTNSIELNDENSFPYTKALIPQKENVTEENENPTQFSKNVDLQTNLSFSTPTQASNGYVTISPTSGGYIKADSLHHHTTPVLNRDISIPIKSSVGQMREPAETTGFSYSSAPNNNNNNNNSNNKNNNMYVTQAQLAELGRCSQVK